MKMMYYGCRACQVSVDNDFEFISHVDCQYEKDTITYAVELFFARSKRYTESCTWESWQLRLAKGKARKAHGFSYEVPAILMELPGKTVQVDGKIDPFGVKIGKVEIFG